MDAWPLSPAKSFPAEQAEGRLQQAIENPEYMLHHWIELPTSPSSRNKSTSFKSKGSYFVGTTLQPQYSKCRA